MSQESGAWLVVRPQSGGSGSCDPVALPVPRQACLGLARAVLAGCDDAGRWLALCGDAEAVRTWLAARGLGGDGGGFTAVRPPGPGGGRLIAALAEDLVVGALPAAAAPVLPAAEPVAEALLLAEAVGRMLDHGRVDRDFAGAVLAARLEAARELAYGAGHEINNPLANIATRAQALMIEERDSERRRRLATIVDQSFRARDMIGGLMLFARPPKPRIEEADVACIVAAAAEAVGPLAASRGVRVAIEEPAAAQVLAHVDRGQVEEALRAIVTNAVEAAADGGRVVVAARAGHGASGRCEITVVDDGSGMDEATVGRAFDPFFSGREAGRGAGLGLSKAWRFVEASGGTVTIASRPAIGTTVTIRLPAPSVGKVCPASPA